MSGELVAIDSSIGQAIGDAWSALQVDTTHELRGIGGQSIPELDRIEALEAILTTAPGTSIPTFHHFFEGCYMRIIHAKADTVLIGHQHRHSCINLMLQGRVMTLVNGEVEEFLAPWIGVSGPFTRKASVVVEDMIWATLHNTNETSIPDLEESLLIKSATFKAFEQRLMADSNTEKWMPVLGYVGIYEVSSKGRVRSSDGRIRKQFLDRYGYPKIVLCRDGVREYPTVHKLVANAFLGSRPPGFQVNHKSGVKTDNDVSNLEFCSASENQKHSFRIGLHSSKGMKHSQSRLTDADIVRIRALRQSGLKQTVIAEMMGVLQSHISRITNSKAWSHITP